MLIAIIKADINLERMIILQHNTELTEFLSHRKASSQENDIIQPAIKILPSEGDLQEV